MGLASKHENLATKHAFFKTGFPFKPVIENWISMDVSVASDVFLIEAGGVSFVLHKYPLLSRSGLIRKIVEQKQNSDCSKIELPEVPGGAEAFELAVKFCYGFDFELTIYNIAPTRCIAEYLEMKEEYEKDNLIAKAEAFLDEVVAQKFANAITVLCKCQTLLPLAEKLQIVSRCIDIAASTVLKGQLLASNLSPSDVINQGTENVDNIDINSSDWWLEDLSILGINFYQRVLTAMTSKGLRSESIRRALVHYADNSLRGLARKQLGPLDPTMYSKLKIHCSTINMEHEQRVLVEAIVSLLPPEKNAASLSFLFGLLRTAIIVETTLACRLDLETRIGAQLHYATLDDFLIPSCNGGTLFDVDVIHRLVTRFLKQYGEEDVGNSSRASYESEAIHSPSHNATNKVAKLVDGYLAEIAPDANLSLSKFIALAGLLPDYARVVDDDLYRAIDVYMKAHPALTDIERRKLCRLLDFQKLSQEASTHAAQNERLPVQAVVQVLYFEQMRIRNVMTGSLYHAEGEPMHKISSGILSSATVDHYASVRMENRELKLEVARMRMRLSDLEKDHKHMKYEIEKSHSHHNHHNWHHHHHHGFLHTVSRTLSKLNPFHHHKLNPFHVHNHDDHLHHDPTHASSFPTTLAHVSETSTLTGVM